MNDHSLNLLPKEIHTRERIVVTLRIALDSDRIQIYLHHPKSNITIDFVSTKEFEADSVFIPVR